MKRFLVAFTAILPFTALIFGQLEPRPVPPLHGRFANVDTNSMPIRQMPIEPSDIAADEFYLVTTRGTLVPVGVTNLVNLLVSSGEFCRIRGHAFVQGQCVVCQATITAK